jgi:branched-chain amino acid transport system substrate-binding protein
MIGGQHEMLLAREQESEPFQKLGGQEMLKFTRRNTIAGLAALTAATSFSVVSSAADDRSSIKIGYAVSKSGGNATGAGITTIPNYELWVKDVNAAGGLELPDGSRLPLEVIEYDDRSQTEEVVRAIQRLGAKDKVDFILPPWGTGFNLAVAPLMDKFGYPHLAVTAVTDKAPEFAKRWNKSFWFLGGGADYAEALSEVLSTALEEGQINNKIAMISVADGFGIDLVNAARPALEDKGFELAYDVTYPLGTSDFAAIVNDAKNSGADSFIAFSYPPGTFGVTKQAQVAGYNPKVFYTGVGGAFPVFKKISGGQQEGVMGIGGVQSDSEAIQTYFAHHTNEIGNPPDSWASAVTYTSLQMLQEAIRRVGLDRNAVAKELSTGEFDTIMGKVKLEDNQLRTLWWAGQWQGDNFAAIAPAGGTGTVAPVIPKPAWK